MKFKKYNLFLIFSCFLVFLFCNVNFALGDTDLLGGSAQVDAFVGSDGAGYESTNSLGSLFKTLIEVFLGLLGIIFLVLVVLAGY